MNITIEPTLTGYLVRIGFVLLDLSPSQLDELLTAIAAVKSDDETPLNTDLDCSLHEHQAWDAATHYQGGEEVLHNGKIETLSAGVNHAPGSLHDEQSKCECDGGGFYSVSNYEEACDEFEATAKFPDVCYCGHDLSCHRAKP